MTGATLKRLRRQLDETQAGFAESLGVTSNTVARWERDEVPIRAAMATAIRLLVDRARGLKRKAERGARGTRHQRS